MYGCFGHDCWGDGMNVKLDQIWSSIENCELFVVISVSGNHAEFKGLNDNLSFFYSINSVSDYLVPESENIEEHKLKKETARKFKESMELMSGQSDNFSHNSPEKVEILPLTKREHFAGLAMQGLIANSGFIGGLRGLSDCAEASVMVADELLKELDK